ncbi:unnamed protein product [Blepharisma stoltei]|uniref:Uncharacterized protein n=1 Tax=Blepharisma stoltei TaxID=1481888 RepID=A0AAU9IEN8_9CILI|nr:unnamed protein product [Blepharisma stoltei]
MSASDDRPIGHFTSMKPGVTLWVTYFPFLLKVGQKFFWGFLYGQHFLPHPKASNDAAKSEDCPLNSEAESQGG